jgi:hypothetical protein
MPYLRGSGWDSHDEIAFGIAVMGLESGFNPRAKGTTLESRTDYGLSQFTDETWEQAVNHYNTRPEHATLGEPHINPAKAGAIRTRRSR